MIGNWSSGKNDKSMDFLSFLFFIVSLIVSVTCDANSRDTVQQTLPAYALALKAETILNSSTCGQELGIFRDAVDNRKWWALKMLDASGRPKMGFAHGNNLWFGSPFQCSYIGNKKPLPLNQEFLQNMSMIRKGEDLYPPYKLNYFMSYFRHNTTVQYYFGIKDSDVISLGLCLPASCIIDQLSSIFEIMFRERSFMFPEPYKADFKLLFIKNMKDDRAWLTNPRMIIVLLVIAITILLMIVGTAYDILVYQEYLKAIKTSESKCNNQQNTLDGADGEILSIKKLTDRMANTEIPEIIISPKAKQANLFWHAVRCFSINLNTKYIFTTNQGSGNIDAVDGMRFLSMAWIVMMHTALFSYDYIDNPLRLWKEAGELESQVISHGSFVVDTFYFMSAFLMAYFTFKYFIANDTENKPMTVKTKIGIFFDTIWKRFVRLTPAYMMTIGISEMIYSSYGNTSVFFMKWEIPQDACPKYWWRNLLYINNFFPRNQMCLSWSYYLSNDMQFFILGNFLVILSTVYFYSAATLLGLVFITSSILTGYSSYNLRYEPTLDDQVRTIEDIYDRPWTRIGPYIVGIVAAYILIKLNNKLTLRWTWLTGFWLIGSICDLLVLFGLYNTHLSVLTSAFYAALSRTAWSIGIAWVLIACCTGNAGIVNKILSLKVWIPLSKITYSVYLLNPLMISIFYLQSEFPAHSEPVPNVVMFAGYFVITYIISYAFSIMFESPYVRLMKLITTRGSKKR